MSSEVRVMVVGFRRSMFFGGLEGGRGGSGKVV